MALDVPIKITISPLRGFDMDISNGFTHFGLLAQRCAAIVLLSLIVFPAQAMTTFTFQATVNDGSAFDGTVGYGSVTYDETWLNSSGTGSFAFLDPVSAFDISLTIFGQTFGRGDDIDRDEWGSPELFIENSVPSFLSFIISEVDVLDPIIDGGSSGTNYTAIDNPQILTIAIYNGGEFVANPAGSDTDFSVGVELFAVPVPATVWLFATALAGLAGVSNRRRLVQ
jgi:hypothetical protein